MIWRPRELNYGADLCCNNALESQTSFMSGRHPLTAEFVKRGFHLFVQSDGGCRTNVGSATGWRILAAKRNGRACELLQRGGTFSPEAMSSLTVETLALEEVLVRVESLIRKWGKGKGGASEHEQSKL